jgi:vacuolar protein sorting-associated protein 72
MSEQRTFRKSTQEISRGFRKRREEEEEMKQWRTVRRPKKAKRQLTHEEMLEEAKWTELENLASLEAYTKTMAEKKKVKAKKVGFQGPVVRYLSVVMPLVEDADRADNVIKEDGEVKEECMEVGKEEEKGGGGADSVIPLETKDSQDSGIDTASAAVSMETDGSNGENTVNVPPTSSKPHPPPPAKQSRNFMIFTDTNNFPSAYFPKAKRSRPRRKLCPVTGLPAKYIDPLTRTPYATPFAFKVIRMRYVSEAEEKCEQRLIQLSSWLEEKKKKKMETT